MRIYRGLFTTALCCALALALGAQQEKESKDEKEPAVAAEQGMPKPGPEMTRLAKWLVGTWTTLEKHEPNEYVPKGGTGTGREVTRRGPGGLSLISDYQSTGPMGKFAGHGIIYWDASQQVFSAYWCDNVTPTCEPGGIGKWDGNDLVFRGETGPAGKKVATVQRYSNIKPGSFTFTIDMANPEGEMKRAMTVEYKRAGGTKPASR